MMGDRMPVIGPDDPRVRSLASGFGKRALAQWVLNLGREHTVYREALQEIARWDQFKTLGYEGPKRVAEEALASVRPTTAPVADNKAWRRPV